MRSGTCHVLFGPRNFRTPGTNISIFHVKYLFHLEIFVPPFQRVPRVLCLQRDCTSNVHKMARWSARCHNTFRDESRRRSQCARVRRGERFHFGIRHRICATPHLPIRVIEGEEESSEKESRSSHSRQRRSIFEEEGAPCESRDRCWWTTPNPAVLPLRSHFWALWRHEDMAASGRAILLLRDVEGSEGVGKYSQPCIIVCIMCTQASCSYIAVLHCTVAMYSFPVML